jgi:hypothetical protein
MKKRLFSRRSSEQSISLVCGDFTSSPAGFGCFALLQFQEGCVVDLVLLADTKSMILQADTTPFGSCHK